MPGPMPRLRPSGSSRRSCRRRRSRDRRIDPRERRARAAEAQRRRPGGEYGDVLSPEDFDTPCIEEEPEEDDEFERLAVRHGGRAQAAGARDFRSHCQDLQVAAQAAGPGGRRKTELSQSQSRRYKKLREEIIEDVKSLSLNQARVEALVEQLYDINKKLISLEGKLMRLAELPHPARRVPARISGRGARSQLAAPRRPADRHGWKEFISSARDLIKRLRDDIHALASDTGLMIEFRRIVHMVQKGEREARQPSARWSRPISAW